MLNFDIAANPSVDVLERQVKLLFREPDAELRIDNVRVARGMHYNLDRIGVHIIEKEFLFVDLSQCIDLQQFLKDASTFVGGRGNGAVVLEHAECIKDRDLELAVADLRLGLISKGWKIIYTYYV